MKSKTVSGAILTLIFTSLLTLTFYVDPVNSRKNTTSAPVAYNRVAAYNYAQKYWDEVCSDGYFWNTPSTYVSLTLGTDITGMIGYDCAHFVSCAIGNEPTEQGGGLDVPSRVPPTYGEPGAGRFGDWLINSSMGVERSSVEELEMGDVINYDWDGDGHWDHVALYLGNNEVAAHTQCVWKEHWQLPGTVDTRFIHITAASGVIYIRPDGSIDPPTAPIQRDGDIYTLTSNIISDTDGIIIQRDDIILNGAGYSVQGTVAYWSKGIDLSGRINVTVTNTKIMAFHSAIYLGNSSGNTISGNNLTADNLLGISLYWSSNYNSVSGNTIATDNWYGIVLYSSSSYNVISGNNITANNSRGIWLEISSNYNSISGNNIASNEYGIVLHSSSSLNNISGNNITDANRYGIYFYPSSNFNSISGNNIANSQYGIYFYGGSNNIFYHNNFIDNGFQAVVYGVNAWDDGYPPGGNYWSDYTDTDLHCGPNQDIWGSDGIWDHPYIIDANNTDHFPLVRPFKPGNLTISIALDKYTYNEGDKMYLGLNVENPDSVKYLCFALWCELPDGSIYWREEWHWHSSLLPIGLSYTSSPFKFFILPTIPSGTYTWHASFLDRATHTILVEDTAEWEYA